MNKKKYDVLVIGELNVDLILNGLSSVPETGKEKLAEQMTLTLGGSSAIFACNLSAFGSKVAFIGRIGDDYFGRNILDTLSEKKVDISKIIKDKEVNTGATIVLNYNDDRAMVTYRGAMSRLTAGDIAGEVLSEAGHLHISSYFLQPGIKKEIGKIFERAKNSGLTTSFDMQWDPAEKWDLNVEEVLPNVDIFLPNRQELMNITGEKKVEDGLKKIMRHSNIVVVKMGSKGSVLANKDKTVFKESFLNKNIVDAIGAGDSFNAGFIYKFISGADLEECQIFGNLMGAVNTTAAGGTTAFTNFNEIMKIAENKFGYKSE